MKEMLFIAIRESSEWLIFENPVKLLHVDETDEITSVLEQLDTNIEAGKYIAGFFSYEASSGMHASLPCKDLKSFPKLYFGVFDDYRKVETLQEKPEEYQIGLWQASQKQDYYDKNIQKIKSYIAAGDTYQVNYTMPLSANFSGSARSLFCDLVKNQQAAYAAYVEFGDYSICSVSPELFFKLNGEELFCKPMKGTAPRGKTLIDDLSKQEYLRQSEKERAENLMIVDMVRNDMGKICESGSVEVTNLYNTERYPTLWQMTSDVKGLTTATFSEIVKALFPCASITGAPKTSTMKIIKELERTPRNIYTGSIGYFGPGRKAQFNVAIRTVLIDKQKEQAEFGVGGGIVWDSVDKNEYEECRIKAKVLTQKSIDFQLLETMLWEKEKGFFLLDYHLKRICASAEYFLFSYKKNNISEDLNQIIFDNKNNFKVRLLLSKEGKINIEKILLNNNLKNVLKVGFAKEAVNKEDIFLYHKTTRRNVYNKAIAQAKKERLDDILLWNEKGELTESTISNLVVKKNGKYLTPPIECGLLNGSFRQFLIDKGKIEEEVILKKDLHNFNEIYLINSVRKWQKVGLVFWKSKNL